MKCVIKVNGRVSVQVLGLLPEHSDYFYKKFGVDHPTARFQPMFQLGTWDGKIRFWHKDGRTSLMFLEEAIPDIVKWGYEVDVINDLPPSPFQLKDENIEIDNNFLKDRGIKWPNGEYVIPYEHQVRVVNALLSSQYGVANAATGAGKSLICAIISRIMNESDIPTLIIVPSIDLVKQTTQSLREFGVDTGQYGDGIAELEHTTIVSTWQTLQNNKVFTNTFGCIIVDETHMDKHGSQISDILENYSKNVKYVYGVTGTIPKDDLDRLNLLRTIGGPIRITVPAKELMDAGVLATVNIDMIEITEDLTKQYDVYLEEHRDKFPDKEPLSYIAFKKECFPEFKNERDFIISNKARNKLIASHIKQYADVGENIFVLVPSIPMGRNIQKELEGSVFLYGAHDADTRKARYDMYADNDGLVTIANVAIASTGLNIPRIHRLVMVDIGNGYTRVIQSIGRSLRIADDKKEAFVDDIYTDLPSGRRHASTRRKFYREAHYPFSGRKIAYKNEEN